MRVVSGIFSGLNLAFDKDVLLRPTQDRVKEAVINKLRPTMEGARVLDLFAGIGSYGIECISSGANFVTLVDTHLHFIHANINTLLTSCEKQGLHYDYGTLTKPETSIHGGGHARNLPIGHVPKLPKSKRGHTLREKHSQRKLSCTIDKTSVHAHKGYLPQYLDKIGPIDPFQVIFLDPPWTNPDLFQQTIANILALKLLDAEGYLVVEHPKKHRLTADTSIQTLTAVTHSYGNTSVSFLRYK